MGKVVAIVASMRDNQEGDQIDGKVAEEGISMEESRRSNWLLCLGNYFLIECKSEE